jgi:hypothetical protein
MYIISAAIAGAPRADESSLPRTRSATQISIGAAVATHFLLKL